jgi:hypothetical protein
LPREILGKSSLTISAKPVGVGPAYQRLILRGARSGLLKRTATMESVFVVRSDEKLTAFLELEPAIRGN